MSAGLTVRPLKLDCCFGHVPPAESDMLVVLLTRGRTFDEQLPGGVHHNDYRAVALCQALQPPWPGNNQRRAAVAYAKMAAQGEAGRFWRDVAVVDTERCYRAPWTHALLQAYLAGSRQPCFVFNGHISSWTSIAEGITSAAKCLSELLGQWGAGGGLSSVFEQIAICTKTKPRHDESVEFAKTVTASGCFSIPEIVPYA